MRNSNVMAIAPTATIANITGVSQSIEPTYQNLYVKSNLSGEFTVVNPYLVSDLKERGLWDQVMVNDLKYYDGSVQAIDRIPADLKAIYSTAFEVEPRWLVESASRRQKWIDQAQSLNLYINNANGKKLDITYRMAWYSGLKTTYYLRSLAATGTEKSTIDTGTLNAVSNEAAAGPAPVPAGLLAGRSGLRGLPVGGPHNITREHRQSRSQGTTDMLNWDDYHKEEAAPQACRRRQQCAGRSWTRTERQLQPHAAGTAAGQATAAADIDPVAGRRRTTMSPRPQQRWSTSMSPPAWKNWKWAPPVYRSMKRR